MKEPTVCILLATYNGCAYIRQMIDSVLAQDYPCIQLVLSDDGSSDGTQFILEEYVEKYPEKVMFYKSGQRFGNAGKHFMHLLKQFCDSPYIMFCDQDDVWHKDKIRKTLLKMQQVERGEAIPAMVHTDLRVVDSELQEINSSFWRHSNLDGSRLALNQLLVQNVVTGCTMMINRPLAELACRETPDEMIMHDWWLALLAAACGKADFIAERTIDYRQHGNNSVGAKDVRSKEYLWYRLRSKSMRNALKDNAKQAEALLQHYKEVLKSEQIEVIQAFIKAQKASFFRRNHLYIKYGLLKYGVVRKTAQLLGL